MVNNSRHYGGKIRLIDSLKYSVLIAQYRDLILQKQKFYFAQPTGIFLLATWPRCSITWSGHVTKRGINTQRSATICSCSLPLTCLITRGETLLLLSSKFSSLLFLLYQFFFSFTASENTLRQFQIIFLPNSNFISSKLFSDNSKVCLCLISLSLHTQSILLPLEFEQCALTLASVLACTDSVDELWLEARVNLKLHNPHEVPRKRFNWRYIDQVSNRLLPW